MISGICSLIVKTADMFGIAGYYANTHTHTHTHTHTFARNLGNISKRSDRDCVLSPYYS
ncbi:hypothetical protein Barb6XT_00961 [Bacteroidales bacterium Barb6XT]|nr:hypothetical protein Barb6XT_00961 [Bacteroidales bacterium Barb6XT]